MNDLDYVNWLNSRKVGDRICIREEINGSLATKQIVSISPRKLIELRGWKNRFKNGRNIDGWKLVPKYALVEERKNLIQKIENCNDKNICASLYRKFDLVEEILKFVNEGE